MMRLRSILTAVLALSAFTSAAQSRHPSPDSGPATFGGGTYSYDAAGNIIAIDAQTFLYNPEGSLKQATVMAPDVSLVTQTYTYDVYGNLLSMVRPNVSQTFSVDTSNNHLTNTGAVYEDGNLKEWMPSGTSTTYQYGWDALGNLQTLRLASQPASAPPAVAYLYTASDERVSTFDVPNATSHWAIRDLGGQVLSDFVDSGSSSWSWTRDYFYRDGAMLASALPNILQHFTLDHLGTPRLITDDQTRQIAAQTFLPFGEELQATFADGASIKKFTAHERDSDPGLTGTPLDYMHARYYGGTVGRFLSVDPARDIKRTMVQPQLWNRYAYALNNPMVRIDPDGRRDKIYVFSSNGVWDSDVSKKQIEQAGHDLKKATSVVRRATKQEIQSGAKNVDKSGTDIVVITGHTVDNGKEGAHQEVATWKAVGHDTLTVNEIADALEGSKPQAVILLGCSTADMAKQLSEKLGVRTTGTTGDFNQLEGFSEFNNVVNGTLQGEGGSLTNNVDYQVFDPPGQK